MTSNQHRCVFVGNIPYDASEEQLIRICEEVGPVVSFRLVLDRETGKPKGYGFCEYRDEETALSARRNLQGYEINGRQLRVDFAENEKGSADRNREQGRGGPGLAQNIDVHKQTGGPKIVRDPFLHQPIGLPAAASAAAVMAGMLGGPQVSVGVSGQRNGIGVGGTPVGTDALSNHLAGMSRYQLYEVLSQMKNLIQQNQQQARHILTAYPQLTKALLQAQIMLGLVRAPQMMQAAPTPPQNVQGIPQLPVVQQTQLQQGLHAGQLQLPPQGAQLSQVAGIASQLNQPSQTSQFQPSTQAHLHVNTGSTAMPFPPQPVPSLPSHLGLQQRSQPQASLNVHQPPLPQLPRPLVPPSPPQPQSSQGASFQFPPTSQTSFQPMGHTMSYPAINPPLPNQPPPQQVLQLPRSGADTGGGAGSVQSGQPSIAGTRGVSQDGGALSGRGPAMGALSSSAPLMTWSQPPPSSGSMINTLGSNMHLGPGIANNGTAAFQPMASRGAPIEGAGMIHSQGGPAQSFVQPQTQQQPSQPPPQQQQQQPQVSLEPEQQKALLQQVMNLTPEQINSLPLEQRQQVLQLQQAFRNQAV